jgi:phosphate starvation-inducible PhoH-like protein
MPVMNKDNEMPKSTKSRGASGAAANSLPVLPDLRETRYQSKVFKALNDSQEAYINKVAANTLTFCIGPAGTGKTFCAAMAAASAFKDKMVDRIIITRPLVEAGEKLGYLPGDMNEKVDPYVAPFVDALKRIMGSGQVEALVEHKKIEFLPLAFMRGHSLDNTFLVLDEAQNVTKTQMKLFLTRIGKHTKVIVDGDISQKDINVFGLEDALERLAGIKGIGVHRFSDEDIVRSGIVRDIIKAYSGKDPEGSEEQNREGLNTFLNNS